MSLLNSIVTDENIEVQEERVSTGGGGYKITESGSNLFKINMVNIIESQHGAIGVKIQLETEEGKKLTQTEYITNRDKQSYYIDKKTNAKKELPGYSKICALNYLVNGVWGLPTVSEREIKEYDYDARQEVSVRREVAVDMVGKAIGGCVTVWMEDSYKDKSKPVTKVEVSHFYDPVTNKFASEKKANKEPEMIVTFNEVAEKTPVKDKREMSKGVATTTTASASGVTSANVGF